MLSPQSSIDVAVAQRDKNAGSPSEAAATADGADRGGDGGDDDDDADKAALVAATAAAAKEELAAAESHSLTQGAMKLVYLLAIQVPFLSAGCWMDEREGGALRLISPSNCIDCPPPPHPPKRMWQLLRAD